MLRNFALVGAIVMSLAMAACTSSVQRPSESGPTAVGTATQRVILSASNPVRQVTLSLTDSGKKDAADNQKFSTDTLLEHVMRALNTQSLITPDGAAQLPTVEIQLTGVRVRGTFNAIMWGFMAGADSIDADIVITRADGKPADRFHVSVAYALGGIAGGQDSRMDWMYEKFAERVLQELTRPDAPKKA
jgi:hypothetical protein